MNRLDSRAFFLFFLFLFFSSIYLVSGQDVETTKIGVKIHKQEVKIDLVDITKDHSTRGDCWTVFKNNIYDLSKFTHAGGEDKITPICGKGMLTEFRGAHQDKYDDQLKQYELPKATLQPLVLKEVAKVNPSLASIVERLLKLKGVAMKPVARKPGTTTPPTGMDVPNAQSPTPFQPPSRRDRRRPRSTNTQTTPTDPQQPTYQPSQPAYTPPPTNFPVVNNPYAAFQLGPDPMKDGYIDLAATRRKQALEDAIANVGRTQQNSLGIFGAAFQRPYIAPPVEPVKTYLNPLQQMQAQQTLFSKPGDFSLPVYGSLANYRGYMAEANIDDALDTDKTIQTPEIQPVIPTHINNNNLQGKKHSNKNKIHRLQRNIIAVNVNLNV